jgi:L,D-transpeptidase ErfK/SrfK
MTQSRTKLKLVLLPLLLLGLFLPDSFASPELGEKIWRFELLPPPLGKWQYYQPAKRASLAIVARNHGVSLLALQLANPHYAGGLLRLPTLHLPPPGAPGEVVVNLPERTAYIYGSSGFAEYAYPIAIGRVGWETPTGNYTIRVKTRNPTWYPPQWADVDEPVPPGPHNPLGDRWMGLSAPGYGMHATNRPSSVGFAASHGCMRMYPEQARDLFERVRQGTPVRIIYETLRLGYAPDSRTVYLAVYPDIYHKGTNSWGRLKDLLTTVGLLDFVSEKEMRSLLANPSGTPQPLLGSDLILEVNGVARVLPFSPTPREGDFLVPAPAFARALGGELLALPNSDWYLLQIGKRWLSFSPTTTRAWCSRGPCNLPQKPPALESWGLSADVPTVCPFIPLRAVCHLLDIKFTYLPEFHCLAITDFTLPPPEPNLSIDFAPKEAWRPIVSVLPLSSNPPANSAENPWEAGPSRPPATLPATPAPVK